MQSIVIVGGYGTFGSIVARELSSAGIAVAIAGRDRARAEQFAKTLRGPAASALAVDATDRDALRAVFAHHAVAVLAAGPLEATGTPFLEAVIDASCHAVDLAENRTHFAQVLAAHDRLAARGLTYVTGASVLPGLSLSLALAAGLSPVEDARVALFIGNRNPKGRAAVEAAVAVAGREIAATHRAAGSGALVGFRRRAVVAFPPPVGARATRLFDSPEYDVFPARLGARTVEVRVAFEFDLAGRCLGALAAMPRVLRAPCAALLCAIAPLVPRFGSSGGAVLVELRRADGASRRAAVVARSDGQRLAALPAVLAARALLERVDAARGAMTAPDLLGAAPLLSAASAAGFDVILEDEDRVSSPTQ